ncbi:GntR family transcriptional regulator [Nocardiopsis aegyptia]|uniref:DNA-binding GntR family transcriptional regulator n=1 Tax=Nocardiopsis aegyptia TaxID=220378 RepID=A0A7Z0ENQ8_9ACTN|nr:UTRA domain-containing protein [Nocardiopsis aegyptia]NYJ34941.1 DNA-binding GntR family transcriptional regulator [Nocardiopsis aegyptia]
MGRSAGPNDDSGSYVTARPAGASDPWTAQGDRAAQRLVDAGEVDAPTDVAEALDGQDRVVTRRRVMLFDDVPVELTDSYYPLSVASGTPLEEKRKVRGGAPTLLAELGYAAHEVVEDVCARPATDDEATALGLPVGSPVLVLLRTTHAADGSPFEVSRMVMRPEGRHLRYRLVVD